MLGSLCVRNDFLVYREKEPSGKSSHLAKFECLLTVSSIPKQTTLRIHPSHLSYSGYGPRSDYPFLIMDLEGTAGTERRDDQNLSRRVPLSLASREVSVLSDVRRNSGSGFVFKLTACC
jgi:hypothetical protein